LVGALGRADLGYPALGPLLEILRDKISSSPPGFTLHRRPTNHGKAAFSRCNGQIGTSPALSFFKATEPDREEKVIDVALGVDLIIGIAEDRFDRVGGDGDHLYPIKLAHEKIGGRLRVHLAPGQRLYALGQARIPFTAWSAQQFLDAGIVDAGRSAPVPVAAAAPSSAPWTTPILTGAFGAITNPPAP